MGVSNEMRYFKLAKGNLISAELKYSQLEKMDEGNYFPQDDNNLKFLQCISAIFDDTLVSITFSALFTEAVINQFGETYLGNKYFYDYLDKLDPKSKLQVVNRLVTQNEIDKNGEMWSDLVFLIRLRNEIVHHKTMSDDKHTIDPSIPLNDGRKAFRAACAVGNFVFFRENSRIICGFSSFA